MTRGATIDGYVPEPLEPKTNEDDLDGTGLIAFLRTISEAPDSRFVEEISRFIDPHVVLTYYAIEVATAEVDGLTSFVGVNNFYLYQLEGTQRFQFIPWDHDFNFTSTTHDIWFGASRNRLIARLLADAQLREFYRETLETIVTEYMNPAWMEPRIDFILAQISDAVAADTKRRGADDRATFEGAVAAVRAVVAGRGENVLGQLRAGRRRGVRH